MGISAGGHSNQAVVKSGWRARCEPHRVDVRQVTYVWFFKLRVERSMESKPSSLCKRLYLFVRMPQTTTFSTACNIVRTTFTLLLSSPPGHSYLVFLTVQYWTNMYIVHSTSCKSTYNAIVTNASREWCGSSLPSRPKENQMKQKLFFFSFMMLLVISACSPRTASTPHNQLELLIGPMRAKKDHRIGLN